MKIFVLKFIFLVFCINLVHTQDIPVIAYDDPEIGIVEHLGNYIPDDIILTDENGNQVNLKTLINKPTIISFVYFRCPGICSPLMDGMAEVMDRTDLVLGTDYQVFTISFDARETTELAIRKKGNYLYSMTNPNAEEGWHFFTADSLNIAKATQAIGFRYRRTGNDFLHTATLITISPEGKITRYLNGTYFLPFEFKMSIIESARGQVGSTINKVLQFCFNYDPVGQQYVMNITKVAGTIIMFFAVIFFLLLVVKPLIRKKLGINTN